LSLPAKLGSAVVRALDLARVVVSLGPRDLEVLVQLDLDDTAVAEPNLDPVGRSIVSISVSITVPCPT
jgi:hypothetical protein